MISALMILVMIMIMIIIILIKNNNNDNDNDTSITYKLIEGRVNIKYLFHLLTCDKRKQILIILNIGHKFLCIQRDVRKGKRKEGEEEKRRRRGGGEEE